MGLTCVLLLVFVITIMVTGKPTPFTDYTLYFWVFLCALAFNLLEPTLIGRLMADSVFTRAVMTVTINRSLLARLKAKREGRQFEARAS